MAIGEVWHFNVTVAADGTAHDVVGEFLPGSYLVLAKASFEQEPLDAPDSSGTLQLLFDDGASQTLRDSCTVRFGAVNALPKHYKQGDNWIISGWKGLRGGVAVINTVVTMDAPTNKLRLKVFVDNARVSEGSMSVMECSIPPRRVHSGPGGVSPSGQ